MDIGALILMGGKNTRMNGFVKGLLNIEGVTFLEKIISNMEDFQNIYLSLNNKISYENIPSIQNMNITIVVDIYEEIGPIGGIYSALKQCKEEYLFVTACDMPFIDKSFINYLKQYLKEDVDVVLCYDKENRIYPLGAIYSKKMLPMIEAMIKENNYKLAKLIYASNYISVCIEDTPFSAEIFTNINTYEDYKKFIDNDLNIYNIYGKEIKHG